MLHDVKGPQSRSRDPDPTSVQIVTDSRLGDLLSRPGTLQQLEPFLGRDSSISEAATRTGEKPNTVLSRVRRWVRTGLLVVTGQRRRAGRPISLYRTSADSYFIPFDTTSAETLEA